VWFIFLGVACIIIEDKISEVNNMTTDTMTTDNMTTDTMITDSTTVGAALAELRQKRGISQSDLAEVLDVSRQAVSRWELDAARPSSENLARLSSYFGIPVDMLLYPGQAAPSEDAPTEDPAEDPPEEALLEDLSEAPPEEALPEDPAEDPPEDALPEDPSEASSEDALPEGPAEDTPEDALPEDPEEAPPQGPLPEGRAEAPSEAAVPEEEPETISISFSIPIPAWARRAFTWKRVALCAIALLAALVLWLSVDKFLAERPLYLSEMEADVIDPSDIEHVDLHPVEYEE